MQVMKRYEELVSELYKEPINGLFHNVTSSVLKALVFDVKVNIGKQLFEGWSCLLASCNEL